MKCMLRLLLHEIDTDFYNPVQIIRGKCCNGNEMMATWLGWWCRSGLALIDSDWRIIGCTRPPPVHHLILLQYHHHHHHHLHHLSTSSFSSCNIVTTTITTSSSFCYINTFHLPLYPIPYLSQEWWASYYPFPTLRWSRTWVELQLGIILNLGRFSGSVLSVVEEPYQRPCFYIATALNPDPRSRQLGISCNTCPRKHPLGAFQRPYMARLLSRP